MKITLYLQSSNADTTASVSGDIITVNGADYDLSAVPDGGMGEPIGEHPFVDNITRIGGVIHVGVLWQYDGSAASSQQVLTHPVITTTTGDIANPVIARGE